MRKLFIVLIVLLIPSLTLAATIKTGDSVEINNEDKNPYVFSQNIDMTSDLTGDAVIFGQNINVNKNVGQSLFAFAESVDVSSDIGQSIRSGGNTILISGTVGEDVLVGANTLTIAETSNIKGDLVAGGATINIQGTVDGDAKLAGAKVVISGSILGNADIRTSELVVTDTAVIGGSLTYWSNGEGKLSEKASIGKGPYFNKLESNYSNTARNITYSLLSLIILALAIAYGFRRFTEKIKEVNFSNFIKNLGWGILTILMVPIISIVIFSISVHLGLVLATSYLTFLVLAYGISAVYTGAIVQGIIQKDKKFNLDWVTVLIGGFVFIAVGYIPVIGSTIQIGVYLASFGYLTNKAYSIINSKSAKTQSTK